MPLVSEDSGCPSFVSPTTSDAHPASMSTDTSTGCASLSPPPPPPHPLVTVRPKSLKTDAGLLNYSTPRDVVKKLAATSLSLSTLPVVAVRSESSTRSDDVPPGTGVTASNLNGHGTAHSLLASFTSCIQPLLTSAFEFSPHSRSNQLPITRLPLRRLSLTKPIQIVIRRRYGIRVALVR